MKEISFFKKDDSLIYTISYPPEYFSPNFPGLLMTVESRVEMLSRYARTVVLDFFRIKDLTPEKFVERYLSGVSAVVVGRDFRFGKNASGDTSFLRKKGVEVYEIEDIVVQGIRVSSSLIRDLVQKGRAEEIPVYLGRYFEIEGIVHRDREFGRKLGFPTANIDRGNEKLVDLKRGVYLVRVHFPDGKKKFGVMNVGFRPTVGDARNVKYEVYILDFEGDLYGKKLKLEVLKFMREEKKFDSIEELKAAIDQDVKNARNIIDDIINSKFEKEG
jgi:riboflavin kinase/FMN adenylyltransferase